MGEFNMGTGGRFGRLRSLEGVMEVGLAVAALAFTLVVWLADGTPPGSMTAAASGGATHVTFPTVLVRGNR